MPISLHAAFVPSCRQILGSMLGLLDKAEAHCVAKRIEPEVLFGTRLIADMLPLAFQLKNVAVHSAGALLATRAGLFQPDLSRPEPQFDVFRKLLQEADATLAGIDPDEMESWIGRDMRFEFGERRMDFTADQFLLSFSQPNFYFHASTAFGILRSQGLEIGKRDFAGAVRLKA